MKRNRNTIHMILTWYSLWGYLVSERRERDRLVHGLSRMNRLPNGSADLVRDLLAAIRDLDNCYDRRTGYPSVDGRYELACKARVERAEDQFIARFLD